MKLTEMINEKKFKKEMLEFFGFFDKGGTFMQEQWGDGSWHKIKKSIVDDILLVLDGCRKENAQSVTELLDIVAGDDVLMIFDKTDLAKIRKLLAENKIFYIERVKK